MPDRRVRRKPGENRQRLVAAGIEEFGRLGYHGASTAAIAARAGVPQPHVYANFATKTDLFDAALAAAIAHLGSPGALGSQSRQLGSANTSEVAHLVDSTVSSERMVLQAIAINQIPALAPIVLPQLATLRTEVGESGLAQIVERAGRTLLRDA